MSKKQNVSQSPGAQILLSDDRPRADHEGDRLGLEGVADHLATVLTQQALRVGFILGVEGAWGSGKSTLIKLAEEKLKTRSNPPETIVFNPWLVGDRDSLLAALFGDIADAIERQEDDAESSVEKVGETIVSVAKRVRSYAAHIGALSKATDFLGLWLPGASGASKALDFATQALSKFADAAEAAPSDRPLSEQKRALENALGTLSAPIVVFVDDLERLEPAETIEMIRLIRAVGDLPNIIYVLCYDRDVLIRNIEKALLIDSGARYLEKIVQVSLPLPQPEAFSLRNWFYDECLKLRSVEPVAPTDEEIRRLHRVIDEEGGQRLDTPRDVVRALNALKLYWAPLRDYVDFADLVWIQLVRLKSPELYGWVERYVTDFASVALSAASITKPKKVMRRLKRVLEDDPEGFSSAVYRLRSFLPGLKVGYNPDKKPYAEGFNLDRNELKNLTRDRRLGSPHYFRYYFSFGPASGEMHEAEFQKVLEELKKKPDRFKERALRLSAERKERGGILLSPLFDRLSALVLSEAEAIVLVEAMSDCMDIASFNDVESFSVKRSWEAGERLWDDAFRVISPDRRADVLMALVQNGRALGWLARCLRHGRMDASRQGDFPLTVEDLQLASVAFVDRIESEAGLMKSAWLGGIFYLWEDVLDRERVREKVARLTTDDLDFMRFLHSCRAWIGADRVYRPLSKGDIDHFMDFADARSRSEEIASRVDQYAEDDARLINEVMTAFAEGDEHPTRVRFED